eukprot:g1939.t1
MSMVSLLIAPLLKDQNDWSQWRFGMIAVGLFLLVTFVLVQKQVLTWKDPLLVSKSKRGADGRAAGSSAKAISPLDIDLTKEVGIGFSC